MLIKYARINYDSKNIDLFLMTPIQNKMHKLSTTRGVYTDGKASKTIIIIELY